MYNNRFKPNKIFKMFNIENLLYFKNVYVFRLPNLISHGKKLAIISKNKKKAMEYFMFRFQKFSQN